MAKSGSWWGGVGVWRGEAGCERMGMVWAELGQHGMGEDGRSGTGQDKAGFGWGGKQRDRVGWDVTARDRMKRNGVG